MNHALLSKRRKRERTGIASHRGPGRKRVDQGIRMHSSFKQSARGAVRGAASVRQQIASLLSTRRDHIKV